MDPNEALRLVREALGELEHSDDDGVFDPDTSNTGQAISAFFALDEWLTKGGFLPDAWKPRYKPQVIMAGEPGGGFQLFGPFDSPGDATAWAEDNVHADSWWVMDVHGTEN